MGNVFPFRRSRFGGLGRYSGFLAFAALIGGVFLYQSGYWPANIGSSVRVTDRYIEIRDGKREIRMPVQPNASAIDGDSLRIGGENIRLIGIDAPELRQTCRDELGRDWACGREAHALLRRIVSRGKVTCALSAKDRYGRTLARCSAGDIADVGEALVREGYAIDFMKGGYHAAEAEARAAKRGIWRGEFERPSDWRAQHPRAEG
jgi:endonuclease YncB( thermonuclease family)